MTHSPDRHQEEDSSWLDLSVMIGLPMALRAALVLNVPNIISSAYPVLALSTEEICAHIPETTGHPASPKNLEKILDHLCCNGVFSLTVEQGEGNSKLKKYAHSPKSRCLVKDQISGGVLMYTSPEISRIWPHAHEIVLNPEHSVSKLVCGKDFYQYLADEAPQIQRLYVGMLNTTSAQALNLLEKYDGEFKSLTGRFVDVGGQEGTICSALLAKYPHLKFVNFDLPEVIKAAPQIPGVEHVPGSFFESVPDGSFLFMKFCLLNWNDESCIRILRNCRRALYGQGRTMLIIDRLDRSVESQDSNREGRSAGVWSNLLTTVLMTEGRTRTLEELKLLASSAGFAKLEFVHGSPGMDLLEATID